MPEGLEVELYRRTAGRAVGRRVAEVIADERCAAPGLEALVGHQVESADRVGKLLLLRTSGPLVGMHFGMTGRLVVDGTAPIEQLEYGSGRDESRWDRLVIGFDDGGSMRVNDPRRWSRTVLEPDVSRLGPDVLSITRDELAAVLHGRRRPVKGALLDQHLVAGLGNLCVDEVLWHAGVAPDRGAGELTGDDIDRTYHAIATALPAMLARGGSHTGVLSPGVRAALPGCPLDGEPLARRTIAGRTTVWCPRHQSGPEARRPATLAGS